MPEVYDAVRPGSLTPTNYRPAVGRLDEPQGVPAANARANCSASYSSRTIWRASDRHGAR
jgi:hypothetical protein